MSGFDQLPTGDLDKHIADAQSAGREHVGSVHISEARSIARARTVEATSSGSISEALSKGEISEVFASQLNLIGSFYHTYIQAQPYKSRFEYESDRAQYPKRLESVRAAFLVLDAEENSDMIKLANRFSYYGKRLSNVLSSVRLKLKN